MYINLILAGIFRVGLVIYSIIGLAHKDLFLYNASENETHDTSSQALSDHKVNVFYLKLFPSVTTINKSSVKIMKFSFLLL